MHRSASRSAPARRRKAAQSLGAVLSTAVLGLVIPVGPADADVSYGYAAAPWPASFNVYTTKDGTPIGDVNGDMNPPYLDLASGPCTACVGPDSTVALTSDGTNAFFRVRLATDITDTTKGGLFGGAFLTQIAVNGVVKAVVGVDGKQSTQDYVYVADSVGGVVNKVYGFPWTVTNGVSSAGVRVISAGDGSGQFFLDYQVPLSVITSVSGGAINASTPIQLYYGSSAAANLATINKDFMLGNVSTVDFSNLATVRFVPLTYAVTFDTQGGGAAPATQTVTENTTATAPTDPTRAGYVFAGWYTTATGGTQWNFTTSKVTAATTLYAHWIQIHTLTFDSTGGSAVASEPVNAAATPTAPTAPTRAGYTFDGWFTASTGGTPFDFTAPVTSDATAYAHWTKTPVSYLVTFSSNGGSSVAAETTVENTAAAKPADPTRAGYTFDGWFTDPTAGAAYDFTSPVTGALTLYAHWTQNVYTVVFDSAGGSPVPNETVLDGTVVHPYADPDRTGYHFDAWYTGPNGTGTMWDFNTPLTGPLTLYANWIQNTYPVTFDSNGGSPVPAETITEGSAATLPAAPARTGYTFGGWYTDPTSGTAYDFTTAVSGPVPLYAHWTHNVYSVIFDPTGGTPVPGESVTDGTAATKPADPTRTGYGFSGWYTGVNGTGTVWDFNNALTGPLNLYANWLRDTYTVTFDATGGTTSPAQPVLSGDTTTAPAAPSRVGYTFDGWFTDPVVGTAFDFTAPVTGDVTAYAHWTQNAPATHTVTFNSNDGDPDTSVPVTDGATATAPAAPTRVGYTFDGWFTDPAVGTAFDFTAPVTGDVTAYAHWTQNTPAATHTVTFDGNGGSAVPAETVVDGSMASAPLNPVRIGYSFAGWFTAATGGAAYDFSAPVSGAITLYAHWAINTHAVTFDATGGSTVLPENVNDGDAATTPTAPTRPGYTFGGWFTDPTSGTPFNFGFPITGDVTAYAHWTKDAPATHTVTFNSNDGSPNTSVPVTDGTTATAPAAPSRAGYAFDGWFTDATAGNPFDFTAPVTGDVTVYAHWSKNAPATHTVTFDAGGTTPATSVAVTDGTTTTAPVDPTRTGYTFGGWFTDPTSGSLFDFSAPISADVTLYAHWAADSPAVHTLTFNTEGGSASTTAPVTDGHTVTVPVAPTRDGYTFDGWFTDPTGGVPFDFTAPVTGDETAYAHWTKNAPVTHTVTFNTGSATNSQTVTHGGSTTAPVPPVRKGYTFIGWFTAPTGGALFDFTAPVTGDVTIYARWVRNTAPLHTVTFTKQNGTAPLLEPVEDGATLNAPVAPTRDHYTFLGWFTAPTGGHRYHFGVPVGADMTLYAHWAKNTPAPHPGHHGAGQHDGHTHGNGAHPAPVLPNTGNDAPLATLPAGLGLVLAGIGMMIRGRRRRTV